MNDHAFSALINLVQFDQETYQIKKNIIALQKEVQEFSEQEHALLDQLEAVKKQVHDWRKKVDEQELEMKTLDEKEKDAAKRLDNAATQKEYKALKSEVDHLKKMQHDLEQEVMFAWNKLETAEKELKEKQASIEEQLVKIRADISERTNKIIELEKDATVRMEQRPDKEKSVPDEWKEKYAAMGSRVPNPVVPVLNGACSACFYIITNQDMLRLKRGALLQCKGCFRFLYAPEAMKTEEKAEEKKSDK